MGEVNLRYASVKDVARVCKDMNDMKDVYSVMKYYPATSFYFLQFNKPALECMMQMPEDKLSARRFENWINKTIKAVRQIPGDPTVKKLKTVQGLSAKEPNTKPQVEEAPAPKRRGRPPRKALQADTASVTAEQATTIPLHQPNAISRPEAYQTLSQPAPKKRGRPKKVKEEPAAVEVEMEELEPLEPDYDPDFDVDEDIAILPESDEDGDSWDDWD